MTDTLSTIYKLDSTGTIRTWRAEVDSSRYRIITGILDGAQTASEWKEAKPKNLGRANETSAAAQALAEVAAQRRKKLSVDYHETIEGTKTAKIIKPMLATKYEDRAAKLDWSGGMLAQPKLDGVRMIATASGLFSRTGKPIVTMAHIDAALRPLFAAQPDLILDGELYNHDLHAEFQRLVGLVRRENPTPEQQREAHEVMQYHVYDVAGGFDGNYLARHNLLHRLLDAHALPSDKVTLVPCDHVGDEDELRAATDRHLAACYEGTMVRIPSAPYQIGKRSPALMKHKQFDDAEFIVRGFEEAEGNWAGTAKLARIEREDGSSAVATMRGTREFLRSVWEDPAPFLGCQATVRYFGLTDDGNLRFPTVQVLHTETRL